MSLHPTFIFKHPQIWGTKIPYPNLLTFGKVYTVSSFPVPWFIPISRNKNKKLFASVND